MTDPDRAEDGADDLLFLPLGGAGEIGMNLNLYCYDGQWLMVDLGITFADDTIPGIDVVLPDPRFIVEHRDDLLGIVLTHAHEDHLGAVPYLWTQLRCPVYATPFTAEVLRRKLAGGDGMMAGIEDLVITEVPLGGSLTLGPYEIEFISLTHSIPEPNALAIKTPAGTVLHTGDWKIDPDPLVGAVTDEAALRRWADDGVLAMVCDSTNVFRDGESGSEADVRANLIELIGGLTGRVAVGCFASNVARVATIAAAAEAAGRHVALVGRSLWRITEAARVTGYLEDLPPLLTDRDGGLLPPDKVLYLCTGCQGEPRAALSRIASNNHPHITLGEGDTVIFSSKIIPGNELAINRLQNRLIGLGVEIMTEDDHDIHVSGHPCRDELAQMYRWVKPRISVPVHGEARHLLEHARYARTLQVPESVVVENGDLLRLAPGPAEVVDHVHSGRLLVDGKRLLSTESDVIRARRRLMNNGVAFVTLVLDGDGELMAEPRVVAQGVFSTDDPDEEGAAALIDAAEAVRTALAALPRRARDNDETVGEAARIAARRALNPERDKRPVVEVQVVRI